MRFNKRARLLAIGISIFFVAGLYTAEGAAKEKYEEKFEKNIELAKDGKVKLKNISGDIDVKSWDRDQVKIDALKIAKASTLSQAKENAQKVGIEVIREGNILRIETKYPKKGIGRSLNVSVNFHLWIPEKASIKVKSISGDTNIENVGGFVDFDVWSGDVEIVNAGKGVEGQAVSGDLKIMDLQENAYVKTVSGDIDIHRIKGSVDAESVSGDIEIIDASDAKEVEGKTLSGGITYKGEINLDGRYSIECFSGDIEFVIPAESGFEVDAETISGEIGSEFDIKISGKLKKKSVQGVVNNGGPVVKLKAFSGDIHLKKS